jgi:drug/metabolite transporter (DMT)-like permease
MGPYLGISLSFVALTNTKVGIAATLMSTVPVIVLPLSWYFYKEKLSIISIAGAFITVAGIAMLFLK